MAKVTSKLQVTIPKVIAERYGISPGDEIQWAPAGDVIRVIPSFHRRRRKSLSTEERLRLFDEATKRQRQRETNPESMPQVTERPWKPHEIERGWRREDLYDRDRTH